MASRLDSESQQLPNHGEVLLEFRAGRMNRQGTKVQPDTRKGSILILKTEDGLLHFQWMDRSSGVIEEDQIVFPEEAIFEKVQQSKGRVYILKFHHDNRILFFWMQEPDAGSDVDLCSHVNMLLNMSQDFEDMESEEIAPEVDDEDLYENDTSTELRQNVESPKATTKSEANDGPPSEPESRFPIPATGLADQSASGSGRDAQQLSDLQKILAGLGQIAVPQAALLQSRDSHLTLSEVLRPEDILPVLQQPDVQKRLAPYLPEELQSIAAIRELILSPPFHQQVETFSHLLERGEVDWLQFGIDPAKYGFGVKAFLAAIDDVAKHEGTNENLEVTSSRSTETEGMVKDAKKEPEVKESDDTKDSTK